MSVYKTVIATTHIDKAQRKLTKTELEHLIRSYNEQYIRMTDEHDPRKIPIGRTLSCEMIQLDDGEYAAEATFELYDGVDPVKDDENKFLVFEHMDQDENISIAFDDSYSVDDKFNKVVELNKLIKNHNDLLFSIKNSIEPISVLTIAGAFVLGKIFEGFLHKVGEDTYDIFKKKLHEALETQKYRNEHVLQFALNIKKEQEEYRVNIFLTNPEKDSIDTILKYGFQKLDSEIGKYLAPPIKEINMEYKNKQFSITYFLNGKAKPLIPKDEFKLIDILA